MVLRTLYTFTCLRSTDGNTIFLTYGVYFWSCSKAYVFVQRRKLGYFQYISIYIFTFSIFCVGLEFPFSKLFQV